MVTKRKFLTIAALGAASLATLWRAAQSKAAAAFEVAHSDAEWRKLLNPEQYAVLRQSGTERPFTSPLLNEHRRGVFACAGCGRDLFSSTAKFDSGTGWPSFWAPIDNAVDDATTVRSAWRARRSFAAAAAAISAMSSTTARSRPACATA